MVDPYEAVIRLALDDHDLYTVTDGQIAQQHRYGQDSGEWNQDSNALVFRPIGGLPGLVGWQRVQIEAYCYGDTAADCGQVYGAMFEWLDNNANGARRTVGLYDGSAALVYYVLARTAPRLIHDEDTRPHGMPAYLVLLEAAVAETSVST